MLTRRGWLDAAEVVVGDELIGSDGNWAKVLGVFPQGTVPLFRVAFTDGSELTTCGEHRWQVSQRYGYRPSVKTTAELANDLFEADERHKWRIPVVKPLVGEAADLPIEPYLLGAWLGDGTSRRAEVTTADDQIIEAFASGGYDRTYGYKTSAATTYGLSGGFWAKLKLLGVVRNKHIPDRYLAASIEQRLALLQGLCDTDGTVAKNGSQQSYCSTSETLAQQFRTLVASLGGVCTDLTKPAANKTAHNIYFRLPDGMAGFRLARKQSRLTAYTPRHVPRRFMASVTPVEAGEAVCFAVAAEDHLFCAGRDLIVTHNTELSLRAFLWWDRYFSGKRHCYVAYNQDRTEQVAKDFIRLAEETGFLAEGSTLKQVYLVGGSSIKFTSIGGGLTGSPIDGVCLIDDPIKDGVDARSPTVRADTHNFWRSVARARRHPGTSFIEMATRWHSEDLTGYLIGEGWRYINLKAIAEGEVDALGNVIGDPLNRRPGEALWPTYKPPEFFAEERSDTYWWSAMYQGEPTPDGTQVFRDVTLCEEPPPLSRLRVAIGEDFAYSAKKHSDYSVAVVLGEDDEGIVYVLDVVRLQVEPRQFRDRILELQARYEAPSTAYIARTEQGSVEFLRESGIVISGIPATEDKLSRAIHVAAAWNSKRVKIPSGAPWREAFVREVCGFTGIKDRHDDQVDALAGAFQGLRLMPAETVQNIQPYQRRW